MDKNQENDKIIPTGVQFSMTNIWLGTIDKIYLNNPFTRFNEKLQEYHDFLDDINDVSLIEYDNWERFKPFNAKAGTTDGITPIIPIEDND